MAEFSYRIEDGLNEIIEEKGNGFTALRRVGFNGREANVDIRKWRTNSDGTEQMAKGCQLSEEGAHRLVPIMVRVGFGKTKDVLEELKKREDFIPSLQSVLSKEELENIGVDLSKVDESEFYDPMTEFSNMEIEEDDEAI